MQKPKKGPKQYQESKGKLDGRDVFIKEIPLKDLDDDWNKGMEMFEDSDKYVHKPCTTLVYDNKALIITNHSERYSLFDFLKHRKLKFLECLKLAEPIISGLIYLHCHNLVYCSLTSSSIILDENNTPKFRGAGLIKVGSNHAASKPASEDAFRWMAPEVLKGDPPSFKSDIFSLGIILWEILVDEAYPYKEAKDAALIKECVLGGYRDLFPPDTLPSYRKLIENCWQHDPNDRPDSIGLLGFIHAVKHDMKKQLGEVEEASIPNIIKHPGKLNHKDPADNLFDVAKYCFKMGEYGKARTWYEMAAEKGSASAAYEVAQMYMYGIGVEQDYDEAKKRYETAASIGSVDAVYAIGLMYNYDCGVEQNYQKAIEYYQQAGNKGSAMALYRIAEIYFYGDGVERDDQKTLEYLNRASKMGLPCAIELTGYMYAYGRGVEQNDSKALSCYYKAAREGCAWGMISLGNMYYDGTFVCQDYEEAMEWYQKAIDKSKSNDLCKIHKEYKLIVGPDKHYMNALHGYEKARRKNSAMNHK
ncbi:HCP-like protein [Rhizopus microsporus ATCC 52813]|uniref:HCP-like protein n=2 Tax=Rhizopus microsporus TaxID=58291 RepID=A0A2G4T3Y8_RHIZD|nr:HCP-like protein [Rhizopus microsporus ATCC 52813]PHZ15732.1 HCP-like protein [Rhizopus microsporus ATCC 52813]